MGKERKTKEGKKQTEMEWDKKERSGKEKKLYIV